MSRVTIRERFHAPNCSGALCVPCCLDVCIQKHFQHRNTEYRNVKINVMNVIMFATFYRGKIAWSALHPFSEHLSHSSILEFVHRLKFQMRIFHVQGGH